MIKIKIMVGAVLAAVFVVAGLSVPAFGDELADLEAAVVAAQAQVDFWTDEVARIEGEITAAEQLLADETVERDAAQLIVDEKEGLRDDAYSALQAATAVLASAQAVYDACNPATSGQGNGNGCRSRATENLITPATTDVASATVEYNAAVVAYNAAVEDLNIEQGHVNDVAAQLAELNSDLAAAQASLGSAQEDLAAANIALAEYVPPTPRAQACNGIERAHANVTTKGNGKGKAAEVITNLAAGFNCNI